jgi:hypothetical protein
MRQKASVRLLVRSLARNPADDDMTVDREEALARLQAKGGVGFR